MGGGKMDDDCELTSLSNGDRTVILVGRTGIGKSSTGNSILGTKAFISKRSCSGVTTTSELNKTVLSGGHTLNVIDTPGFFDVAAGSESVVNEILNCIELAIDGFHAILVVLSVRTRFTEEEQATVRTLRTLFGDKITNYMIVIFTGGDDLEEDNESLDDYLGRDCPPPLKEVLDMCGNRLVLFDNKTTDEDKRRKQVDELLSLVNEVVVLNNGKSYSDENFSELQKGAMKLREQREKCSTEEIASLKEQLEKSYEDQLKRMTEMVALKLSETISSLESQLLEEQKARRMAEENAKSEQIKAREEIQNLKEVQQRNANEIAGFRHHNGMNCQIL